MNPHVLHLSILNFANIVLKGIPKEVQLQSTDLMIYFP